MIVSTEKKFIFFHIPKTGGHSVTYRLEKFLDKRFEDDNKARIHTYHENGNLHSGVNAERVKYLKAHPEIFSFAFVRNPWDRAFSFYLSGLRRPKTGLHISPTLEDFSNFLDDIRSNKSRHSASIKTTQLSKLSLNNEIPIDYVARFEKFEEEFEYIINRIGIPSTEVNYNAIDNKANFKNWDYRDFYTQYNVNWIADIHKEDIKEFNYSF